MLQVARIHDIRLRCSFLCYTSYFFLSLLFIISFFLLRFRLHTEAVYSAGVWGMSFAQAYLAGNTSSTKFIIWLEGGGICESLSDCEGRAQGDLGSSISYKLYRNTTRGMLKHDLVENPDFSDFNRVYVPYCSGDVWSGTAKERKNPFPQSGSWKGYFQGHTIVEAVLNLTRDSCVI
jgi:hypothetical protein